MQRGAGSIRTTHRITRFVAPAGNGRQAHLLSRSHSRIKPPLPAAARAAAERDPLGAVRRAVRSVTPHGAPLPVTRATIRPSSFHWSTPRRVLRDPRSFRAVATPR